MIRKRKIEPVPGQIVKTRKRKFIYTDIRETGISGIRKCEHCDFHYRIMCYKYNCFCLHNREIISGIYKLINE